MKKLLQKKYNLTLLYLYNFCQKILNFVTKKYFDTSFWRKKFLSFVKIEDLECSKIELNLKIPETISTPEIKTMNLHHRAKYLQNSHYSLPSINIYQLNKTVYSPKYNIILTNSKKIISNSINTDFFNDPIKFSISHLYFTQKEKITEPSTVLRSTNNSFYHSLIDNIPRLYLIENYLNQNSQKLHLLLDTPPNKIESFFLSKLSNTNLQIKILNPQKTYIIDTLIFPSFLTRKCAGYLPSVYLDFFLEKVTPPRVRNKQNRIFIARTTTKKGNLRCILNEDNLFTELKKYGFKKYVLENLSLEEQIELFYDAEFVIGSHGAGFSNIVYSKNIKLLELFPTKSILPHYYYLSKCTHSHYTYWCGEETHRDANFYVKIN